MKNKVLFFYIHLSGHKIAAEAIQKAISERYNDIETDNFEALAYAYPVAGMVISKLYLELLKYTPQIWDFLYDNKKVVSATNEIREVLNSFNTIKLNKLIKQHSPSCLVCTQAVP
ncbi:MAG TPA: hypothetical protein ENN55_04215, partial [Firmicutes bacterium]|nr:hypothetical protein [Bacillota bacterium]